MIRQVGLTPSVKLKWDQLRSSLGHQMVHYVEVPVETEVLSLARLLINKSPIITGKLFSTIKTEYK